MSINLRGEFDDTEPGWNPVPQRNGRIKVDPKVAFQLVGWLVAGLLTYGAINTRMTVVESKQMATEQRIERIENKIDRLLELAR